MESLSDNDMNLNLAGTSLLQLMEIELCLTFML